MRWRLALTSPMRGVQNMALDERLLHRARDTGEGVVRVYAWNEPTLSLGRHQRAVGAYDPARARALGVAIVRRPTGGRAVLHHREITYSVTAPLATASSGGARDRPEQLRDAYERINSLLVEALRALGASVDVARSKSRTPPPGSAPCFELPTDGELTLAGSKLAGSAQYREEGAYLQHGSILVHDDQSLVAQVATTTFAAVPPAATLARALGRDVAPCEFAGVLFDAVRRGWDAGASPLTDRELQALVDADTVARYASDEWTWRR